MNKNNFRNRQKFYKGEYGSRDFKSSDLKNKNRNENFRNNKVLNIKKILIAYSGIDKAYL